MYEAMLAQERAMRKEIQMFFRNKLGVHEHADIGGNLYIDNESDFVDALNALNGSLSSDARDFYDQIHNAFSSFKSMNMNASLEIWIRFDPQTEHEQTYDMMFNISLVGVSTAAMPISDLIQLTKAMSSLKTETELEDSI